MNPSENTTSVTIRVTEGQKRLLKVMCLDHGTTIQDLMQEALAEVWLKKRSIVPPGKSVSNRIQFPT